MNEMIKRVALAMQEACEGPIGEIETGTYARPHQTYVKCAKVAIEAMLTPTVDMLAAAFPCERDEEFTPEDKALGAAVCLKLGGWDKIGIMGGEPIRQAAFLARDYRLMVGAALPPAHRADPDN